MYNFLDLWNITPGLKLAVGDDAVWSNRLLLFDGTYTIKLKAPPRNSCTESGGLSGASFPG